MMGGGPVGCLIRAPRVSRNGEAAGQPADAVVVMVDTV